MSPNNDYGDKMATGGSAGSSSSSGSGSGSLQAPRLSSLQSGGYASWRPLMETFLRRVGVTEKDYKHPRDNWAALVAEVTRWAAEEEEEAIALVLASAEQGSSSSTTPPIKKEQSSTEDKNNEQRIKEARKLVAASVERSERAYYHILNAMPEELRPLVRSVPQGYAFGLWDFLEKRFQNTEDDNVADLFRRWNDLVQGEEESFDVYKARVDEVNTLLAHANEKPSVRQYTYTLLDKLQPRYKQAVLALKASGQLKDPKEINWEGVVSFLNTHERSEQRLGGSDSHSSEQTGLGMSAHSAGARFFPLRGQQAAVGRDRERGGERRSSNDGTGGRPPRTLADVQCFGCHKFGHLERDCPHARNKSNGKGNPWRQKGGAGAQGPRGNRGGTEQASAALTTGNQFAALADEDTTEGNPTMNEPSSSGDKEQGDSPAQAGQPDWESSYVGKVYASLGIAPSGSMRRDRRPAEATASHKPKESRTRAASPTPKTALAGAANLDQQLASTTWGVDTMASLHCSGNRSLFKNLRKCPPIRVMVANGGFVEAAHQGEVELSLRVAGGSRNLSLTIQDVYYHKSFTANLLGMVRLVKQGWILHASKSEAYIVTPGGNKVHLSLQDNVATLPGLEEPEEGRKGKLYRVRGDVVFGKAQDLVRLHQRLGHVGFKRLLQIVKKGATLDVGKLAVSREELLKAKKLVQECQACAQGKGTRTPFGSHGLDRGSRPFEVLHMDTYEVRNPGQPAEWGLVVTDPFSEFRWFKRLKSKAQCPGEMVALIEHVERQTGKKIKRLHTDGGSEFKGELTIFCQRNGIELHFPPARTPQLNGIAERHVRTAKDGARTLLLHSNLPHTLWYYAATYHTHLWNRTRIADKTKVTPHETMYGKAPSALHLAVFGCDGLMHVPKAQRTTWQPKMEPCIYLGHDWQQNCSVVLVLRTKLLVRTRDVFFKEESFEHALALRAGNAQVEEVIRKAMDLPEPPAMNVPEDSAVADGGSLSDQAPDSSREQKSDEDAHDEASEEEYEVEKLTGKSWINGRVHYKVKWVGFPASESTWEPATELRRSAAQKVREYERRRLVHGDDSDNQEAAEMQAPLRRPVSEDAAEDSDQSSESIPTSESDSASESGSESDGEARSEVDSASDSEYDTASALDSTMDSEMEEQVLSPQVHMLMAALGRDLRASNQPQAEMEQRRQMAMAVASGIAMLEAKTPQTHREAMSSPEAEQWRAAELKEWNSCEQRGTWDLVPRSSLPQGAKAIRSKVVYKIKLDQQGNVTEFKARITPKGFMQRAGVDYFDIAAPTGMYKTMRLGLCLAAHYDLEVDQMDVPSAFLHADLEEDVYMEIPDAYRDGREHLVCKLKKSLYGLKQAPRNWHLNIKDFVTNQMGYTATVSDPCLFHRLSRQGRLMLLYLFVDDFQTIYDKRDAAEWNELKALLVKEYQVKDLGPSQWILGMGIRRDRKQMKIFLDQELYITKALEKYGLAQCKAVATPECLGKAGTAETQGGSADRRAYQEIVGTLLYAAISTRPDIAHAVHQLTRRMQDPQVDDMQRAKRVLRYLSGTKQWCLQFGGRRGGDSDLSMEVSAFADADFANDVGDRRSVSGWVVKLDGDPISWSSKKQSIVAQSTCEAELYAEAAAINEVLWLRGMLEELGLLLKARSIIYGDNTSTQTISREGVKRERTKHIDVKYHFITECIENGVVQLKWVATDQQQADIFTKALDRVKFETHRKELMSC